MRREVGFEGNFDGNDWEDFNADGDLMNSLTFTCSVGANSILRNPKNRF